MISIAFFALAFPVSAADAEPEEVAVDYKPITIVEVPSGMVLREKDDQGRRVAFRPEQEYKCFTVGEWAQMGHIITDYRWLWYYTVQLEFKVGLYRQNIEKLELQMAIMGDSIDVTQRGLDSMTGLLNKEHEARLRTNRNATVELWAWRVGTVLGLVAAGTLGAAWGVERSK